MKLRALLVGSLIVIGSFACARNPEPIQSSTPTAPAASETDDAPAQPIGLVDATIMFTDCGVVSNMNAKLAQKTMHQLVEACSEVPGGTAQLTATLQVDGRIELGMVDGGLGTVPICVLRHELKHKLTVKKPCTMQIQMTERKSTLSAPRPGAASSK